MICMTIYRKQDQPVTCTHVTECVRTINTDSLGRNILIKNNAKKPTGYIILTYPCRALEWIHLRKVYTECLIQFGCEQLTGALDEMMFAWRYHRNMASHVYRPSSVFKKFGFFDLLDEQHRNACLSSKRFAKFLDSRTRDEQSSHSQATIHVRTVDLKLIHHRRLREALSMGLNHIPMRPTTSFATCIATILDGFMQVAQILQLTDLDFPLDNALTWLRNVCLERLKVVHVTINLGFGHRNRSYE